MDLSTYLTLVISLLAIIGTNIGTNIVNSNASLKKKYFIGISIIVTIAIGFITYVYSVNNKEKPITWKDKAFEKMIQKALNKEGEYIYPKQVENIKTLYIISDKVAYADVNKDEFEIFTTTNYDRTVFCQAKLLGQDKYKQYYDKGDIVYLDDIKYFKELSELYIYLNKIEDISPLKTCNKLEVLNLDLNEIQKIQIFDSFKNLRNLSLGLNKIKDISPLETNILSNLESLTLRTNEISNIKVLENLVNRSKLEYLDLAYNRIFEIPNFEEYQSLKTLCLNSNYINNVENLSKLKSIRNLYLGNNIIENISSFKELNSLQNLYISKNHIKDIDNIKNLDLNTLELFENRLKEFPNDFKNKNCSITIVDNFIQDKSSLKDLKNVSSDFQLFDVVVTPNKEKNPTKITVKVNSLHELDYVSYTWNTSDIITMYEDEFEVNVPEFIGNYNFYITAKDKFGNTTKGTASSSGSDDKVWIKYSYTIEEL